AGRYDDAAALLDDPVVMEDGAAALSRQFVIAALFHQTRNWSNVLSVAEVCPPNGDTPAREEVTSAVAALASTAAANLGQFKLALELSEQVSAPNPEVAADVALTRAWCLRELGDDQAARAELNAAPSGDVQMANSTAEPASGSQPKYWHPY